LIDHADVFGTDSSYLRQEQYSYNSIGDLVRIKHVVQNGKTWNYSYDYGYGRPWVAGDSVDFSRYVGETYTAWGWDNSSIGFGYETNYSNISRLWFKDRNIYFEYDDHANPLNNFKSSRPLPIRFSANNPTKIRAMAVNPGGPQSLAYQANLAYTYGDDGLPLSAIKVYENSCMPADTIRYVYDKVKR
jgi:hypothetical protein